MKFGSLEKLLAVVQFNNMLEKITSHAAMNLMCWQRMTYTRELYPLVSRWIHAALNVMCWQRMNHTRELYPLVSIWIHVVKAT